MSVVTMKVKKDSYSDGDDIWFLSKILFDQTLARINAHSPLVLELTDARYVPKFHVLLPRMTAGMLVFNPDGKKGPEYVIDTKRLKEQGFEVSPC